MENGQLLMNLVQGPGACHDTNVIYSAGEQTTRYTTKPTLRVLLVKSGEREEGVCADPCGRNVVERESGAGVSPFRSRSARVYVWAWVATPCMLIDYVAMTPMHRDCIRPWDD